MPRIDLIRAAADHIRNDTAFLQSVGIPLVSIPKTATRPAVLGAQELVVAYYTALEVGYTLSNTMLIIVGELNERYPVLSQAGVSSFSKGNFTIACLSHNTEYLQDITHRMACLFNGIKLGDYRIGNTEAPTGFRSYDQEWSAFRQQIELSFSASE